MKSMISNNQQIINTLLLNTSFINNLGIMHGKMGISICFYHLARRHENKIYEDYAGELIDEIYEEISSDTPIDFENGLAGIGWGIEYLVQNNFIEADTNEVLEEFDNRIFKELIYNTTNNIGLLEGIIGLGAYFLNRIQNSSSNDNDIATLTNKQTLIHIIDELDRRTLDTKQLLHEPTINNGQITNYLKRFDIMWDYPLLIWFLTELFEQNIYNFKIEKIIKRMIQPILEGKWLPELHSNNLLLLLVLTKLSITKILTGIDLSQLNIKPDEEAIKSEIRKKDSSLKTGALGISWIYQQLFHLTSEDSYEKKIKYWKNHGIIDEIENYKNETGLVTNDKNFGILSGLAGIIVMTNI